MAAEVDLMRDLLDKQLAGSDGCKMGRVDGITLQVGDGPPRVIDIRCGGSEIWSRLHPAVEHLARIVRRHTGPSSMAPFRIPWDQVRTLGRVIRVELEGRGSPATSWERWLERRLIAKIPGSGQK